MKNLIIKGLEKAVEDLKNLEDGEMAFVDYDIETQEVWVDGTCPADLIFSMDDIATKIDSLLEIKVCNPMIKEELQDYIEFFLGYKGLV